MLGCTGKVGLDIEVIRARQVVRHPAAAVPEQYGKSLDRTPRG